MIKKHLFLRLYQKDYKGQEKPLTEYIKDFDKNIPIKFYGHNDTSRSLERNFRNLDELILYKKAFINIMFAIKYMDFLQYKDRYEDISLQEIFELSLLMDGDKHPDTDVFRDAYISDSRRNEMNIYETYYSLLLWNKLGVTDLEFSRRILDCLTNSVPSNKSSVTLDDGIPYTSPYIDYVKSDASGAVFNENVPLQSEYNKELKIIEDELLLKIKAPKNIHFDGNRFTILIEDSPISLMFDIKSSKIYNIGGIRNENIRKNNFRKSDHNHHIGGINVQHPTQLQPAFIDREKSERSGSWWNGRTSWDYVWRDVIDESSKLIMNVQNVDNNPTNAKKIIDKLDVISFILLLKNGGNIKGTGDDINDVLDDYRAKRSVVKNKYSKIIKAQTKLSSIFLESYRDREVVLFYESSGGYIAAFYKPYKKSEILKLDSRAEFYDKDFHKVGESSFYSDFIVTQTYKKKFFDGGKKNNDRLKKDMIMRTFKKVSSESNIIAIDYSGVNTSQQLKQYVQLTKGNDGTQAFSPHVYQLELFKTSLKRMVIANSIDTYILKLQEQINLNGYADVNDYKKAVDIVTNDKMFVDIIDSEDFLLPPDTGAQTCPSTTRDIVMFYYKNGRKINTENFSSFERHIEFTDVEYLDALDSTKFRESVSNKDYTNFTELVEYEENYLQKRRDKRKKMIYKKSTNKRVKNKPK